MSRNATSFIPMAGPVREIFDILDEELDAECHHKHRKQCEGDEPECGHDLVLEGLETAANRIAERLGLT